VRGSLRLSFEQAPLSRKWVDIPHIIVDDQDGLANKSGPLVGGAFQHLAQPRAKDRNWTVPEK